MRCAIIEGSWAELGPMVQRCMSPHGHDPVLSDRLCFKDVLYLARTGCPWHDVPGVRRSFGRLQPPARRDLPGAAPSSLSGEDGATGLRRVIRHEINGRSGPFDSAYYQVRGGKSRRPPLQPFTGRERTRAELCQSNIQRFLQRDASVPLGSFERAGDQSGVEVREDAKQVRGLGSTSRARAPSSGLLPPILPRFDPTPRLAGRRGWCMLTAPAQLPPMPSESMRRTRLGRRNHGAFLLTREARRRIR